MKRILIGLLFICHLLFSAAPAVAQGTVQYLVLTRNNAEVVRFALTELPVITFGDTNLIVTCGGKEVLSTSMEGLKSSFEDVSTDIREIGHDGQVHPQFSFGEAVFDGLKEGDRITVYTIDGKAVVTVAADRQGHAAVNLSALGKGVYVLRTPTQSFKIKN